MKTNHEDGRNTRNGLLSNGGFSKFPFSVNVSVNELPNFDGKKRKKEKKMPLFFVADLMDNAERIK